MAISKVGFLGALLITAMAYAQVVTENLPALQIGTIGYDTGLSPSIWGNNPNADDVLAQIRASADAPLNKAEKEVFKRILLTDMGGVKALEEQGETYLTERVHAFLAQGMTDEALLLLSKVPEKQMSGALKQLKAKAFFVAGQNEEACAENLIEAFGKQEAFMRAVCADVIGVPPESALAYEVYRESEQDHFVFFNAAGEVLFRNLDTSLPSGIPSTWEMPLLARAFGIDIIQADTPKENLWVLINQEQVPQDVKEKARSGLIKSLPIDGQVLSHLTQMAKHREVVEQIVKDKNAE